MYIILSGGTSQELQQELNKYIEESIFDFELIGGPYSDNKGHYQAILQNSETMLLKD